jgi:hypothetical protein
VNLEEYYPNEEDFDISQYTFERVSKERYDEVVDAYEDVYGKNSRPTWCGCYDHNWFKFLDEKEEMEQQHAQSKEMEALKERVIELEALLEAKTKKPAKKAGPKEPPKHKRITIEQYEEYQTLKNK